MKLLTLTLIAMSLAACGGSPIHTLNKRILICAVGTQQVTLTPDYKATIETSQYGGMQVHFTNPDGADVILYNVSCVSVLPAEGQE